MNRPQGRICAIDSIRGETTGDLNIFKDKSVAFIWELMFTRSAFRTDDMIEQHNILNKASRYYDEGVLQTTLTENYGELTAANLKKAHARIESGSMIGKLVLGL